MLARSRLPDAAGRPLSLSYFPLEVEDALVVLNECLGSGPPSQASLGPIALISDAGGRRLETFGTDLAAAMTSIDALGRIRAVLTAASRRWRAV